MGVIPQNVIFSWEGRRPRVTRRFAWVLTPAAHLLSALSSSDRHTLTGGPVWSVD